MIALDTNILARYLLNDDPRQAKAALAVLSTAGELTAPASVLLELVWVLEVNGCTREEVLKGVRHLLGLPNFSVTDMEAIVYALRWYEGGMDFGDAVHLAFSARDERFVTFDRAMAQTARRLDAFPPVELKK